MRNRDCLKVVIPESDFEGELYFYKMSFTLLVFYILIPDNFSFRKYHVS